MPNLMLFTICDRVIIDENGVASLIGLFNQIHSVVAVGTEVPASAVAPKEWFTFCIWGWEEKDGDKEFQQIFELTYPDGTQFSEARLSFKMIPNRNHQVRVPQVGFPIGQVGPYKLRTQLLEGGKVIVEPGPLKIEVSRLNTSQLSSSDFKY
jgi:hypothetical protein